MKSPKLFPVAEKKSVKMLHNNVILIFTAEGIKRISLFEPTFSDKRDQLSQTEKARGKKIQDSDKSMKLNSQIAAGLNSYVIHTVFLSM